MTLTYGQLMSKYLKLAHGNMKTAHELRQESYIRLEANIWEEKVREEIERREFNYRTDVTIKFVYDSESGTSYDVGIDIECHVVTTGEISESEAIDIVMEKEERLKDLIEAREPSFANVLHAEGLEMQTTVGDMNQEWMTGTGVWADWFTWYKDIVRGSSAGLGRKRQTDQFLGDI